MVKPSALWTLQNVEPSHGAAALARRSEGDNPEQPAAAARGSARVGNAATDFA